MCGIAGFVGAPWDHDTTRGALAGMCDAIHHRGPDDFGYHVAPGVALGMRRLSIIDVAGGHQPMFNEASDVALVFNGEIYNFRELQQRLTSRGHRLATRSDTETIVHLYEDHGDDVVHHLRGMFGFALWDTRRERLLLGRDRLGIKPLYYWASDHGIAFGSELRSLLTLPNCPREIDPEAITAYFTFGYVPDPLAIFRGIRKLPPGCRLTWTRAEGVRIERYWTPVQDERADIGEAEAIAEIRRLLDESVELHLESEVPLGAFLSGGIDSSAVVATMKRLARGPVRTYSIGFAEASHDESAHAAEVARALGTEHTSLIVRPDVDHLVEDVVSAFDEPFADPSAVPTFLVSALARREVTVALSGDGGDELFAGYTRYFTTLNRPALPSAALRRLVAGAAERLPHGVFGRNWMRTMARNPRGRYATTVALPARVEEGGVMHPDLLEHTGAFDAVLDRWFDEARERDYTAQMTLVDLQTYLPGDILAKVDRTSMASSLEARVPLLDHVFAEYAIRLPSALKVRNGVGKWIFRKAIEDRVPASVLTYPKRGFGVPLDAWFRKELAHRVESLLRPGSSVSAWTDRGALQRVAREHFVGRRDYHTLLWRVLVLDLWLGALQAGRLTHPTSSRAVQAYVTDRGATTGAESASVR